MSLIDVSGCRLLDGAKVDEPDLDVGDLGPNLIHVDLVTGMLAVKGVKRGHTS